jgi:hypothetical protein
MTESVIKNFQEKMFTENFLQAVAPAEPPGQIHPNKKARFREPFKICLIRLISTPSPKPLWPVC